MGNRRLGIGNKHFSLATLDRYYAKHPRPFVGGIPRGSNFPIKI